MQFHSFPAAIITPHLSTINGTTQDDTSQACDRVQANVDAWWHHRHYDPELHPPPTGYQYDIVVASFGSEALFASGGGLALVRDRCVLRWPSSCGQVHAVMGYTYQDSATPWRLSVAMRFLKKI